MNMGKRIAERLAELGWERKDLLDRVPDLTPQALSNLIVRDSKRSEWDEPIAQALSVSILWLVYGRDANSDTTEQPAPLLIFEERRASYAKEMSDDENTLLRAWAIAGERGRSRALEWALTTIANHEDFAKRSGKN